MRSVSEKTIRESVIDTRLEDSEFNILRTWLSEDPGIANHIPDERCQLDPRDGSMVIYSASRARRVHTLSADSINKPDFEGSCPICDGQLTRVLDITALSEGHTFISQNLFPILHPAPRLDDEFLSKPLYPDPERSGRAAYGMHLLQWTSSIHHHDWHNMPINDLVTTLQRIAALEKKLLTESSGYMPTIDAPDESIHGYFSMIKNYGAAAGASLGHGHQQIAFSNIMPQRDFNNFNFYQRHHVTFSQFMRNENPLLLTIDEIGCASIVVPYFMHRPLAMMVFVDTGGKNHLHQLSTQELTDLTAAMQRAIQLIHLTMPEHNLEVSYNFAMNSGPKNEVYFEFFPITQINGGFEKVGLWICQESPFESAERLQKANRLLLNQNKKSS